MSQQLFALSSAPLDIWTDGQKQDAYLSGGPYNHHLADGKIDTGGGVFVHDGSTEVWFNSAGTKCFYWWSAADAFEDVPCDWGGVTAVCKGISFLPEE